MQEQGIAGQGGQRFIQNGTNDGEGGELHAPPGGGDMVFIGPGPGGGAGPGGGPSGCPSSGGGGEGLSPDQIVTAQARRAEDDGGGFSLNGAYAPLIEAFVKFLQEKAGSWNRNIDILNSEG